MKPLTKIFRLTIIDEFDIIDLSNNQIINSGVWEKTLHYKCSEWEVSCILVPASTSKMFIEFKKYLPDGKQVIENHYVTHFEIISKSKNQMIKQTKGFASMDVEKRKAAASIGGKITSAKPGHMAVIGRAGGIKSGISRKNKKV